MTDRILEQLIKLQIINSEEEEIYRFGLEALFLKGVHYISYFFIAILGCEVPKFILFFVAFLLLRKSAGGYHSETKAGCYILSCLTVISVIFLLKHIVLHNVMTMIAILFLVTADVIIYFLAPLGNRNRELDIEETKYFRKRTILVLVSENFFASLFVGIHKEQYALSLILAIICQAILLILQKRKDVNDK